jgi:NAD(P)H-hydrate epimerase
VLRAGAGLCTVAMPADAAALVEGRVPELMIEALESGRELQPLLAGKRVAAVGPGIARDEAARDRIRVLAHSELPLVVDADALNAVAADSALLPRRSSPTVLTPHPGEAARLAATSTAMVQQDRVGVARAIADRFGAVCVLKGARTVIAAADGRLAINPTGNPGLGTGGTGDVLTGCVAAALCRARDHEDRVDAFIAACAAVYLHGAAGDRAAAARSQTGLLASDVLDALPHLLAPR